MRKPNAIFAAAMAAAVPARLLIIAMLERERAARAASGEDRAIYMLCPRAPEPSVSRPDGQGGTASRTSGSSTP